MNMNDVVEVMEQSNLLKIKIENALIKKMALGNSSFFSLVLVKGSIDKGDRPTRQKRLQDIVVCLSAAGGWL
jgi:hypothetical protein